MKRSKDYLQLADALQVSAFISSWWKQLKRKVNACNQSKEQKIMIYSKIAKGLILECCGIADNLEDYHHIDIELQEMSRELEGCYTSYYSNEDIDNE